VVVEVDEEGRQVGRLRWPDDRHSARAIRIFWMSLVPS
jgi:hypothetical protein